MKLLAEVYDYSWVIYTSIIFQVCYDFFVHIKWTPTGKLNKGNFENVQLIIGKDADCSVNCFCPNHGFLSPTLTMFLIFTPQPRSINFEAVSGVTHAMYG